MEGEGERAMATMTEQQLRERLRKIAALFEGAKTAGEREAAAAAMKRVKESLDSMRPSGAGADTRPPNYHPGYVPPNERIVEMQFSLPDQWHRRLLSALCRRHGLTPFRYRRQRHTTLMVRVNEQFLRNILWPEYCQLRDALDEYFRAATDRIIREEIFNIPSEDEEERDG